MVTRPTLFRGMFWLAAAAAASVACAIAAFAAGSSCIGESQREPMDGKWKGTAQLSYVLKHPGAPPIKVKLAGDLNFNVVSETEKEEFVTWPEPPKKQKCWRTPLGGQPMPGCDTQGNPIPEKKPPKPAEPAKPEVKTLESRARVRVVGKGNVAVQSDIDSILPTGEHFKFSMPTQAPASLRTQAKVTGDKDDSIVWISLMGSPSQFNFLMSASTTGPSGSVQVTGKGSGTGSTSETLSAETRGPCPPVHGTVTAGSFSGEVSGCKSTGQISHGNQVADTEQEMLRLNDTVHDCWLMSGGVDTNKIRQSLEGSGMEVEFTEARWEATLQDRDRKYEQDVERFVNEPVRENVTEGDLGRIEAEIERLRPDRNDVYRNCVFGKVSVKWGRTVERLVQTLLDRYPRASDGATAAVLCAVNQELGELVHELALIAEDCPLIQRFQEVATSESQALLAKNPGARCPRQ